MPAQLWSSKDIYIYYNYEKYPLSPLKPRFLGLIEQYLPNISDPVYSVHKSFMWFLWLNWRKSTFYPVTAPKDSKCWPIVTSSIQEPVASNCDTMTDCFCVVARDAFLAQCFNSLLKFYFIYIYIIISKNIRYLLWNRGAWRSLNNTHLTFLDPCIRCTNNLCDSCDITDVNPHFIPSLLRKIQNVDLLWRHRYRSRPPAIVTSQWPIVPDSDLKSLWKTRLCQVFQHSGKNLWSREMFVKWRHD